MNIGRLSAADARTCLNGRDVLAILLGFFGVVFTVNAVMIAWAISTNTGLVASEPYRAGLQYNERIAADDRQIRLGWMERLEVKREGRVVLALAERDGRPVAGLRIEGMLGRPSTNRLDIALAFREAAPGRYEADSGPLGAGNWLFAVIARPGGNAQDPIYRLRRRLWLRP